MVYYSFYLDDRRRPEDLRYRTQEGFTDSIATAFVFENQAAAEKNLFSYFLDNEDFRFGKYHVLPGTEPKSKKSKPKSNEIKRYQIVPDDFSLALNKVYHLDCLTFMSQIPGQYYDHVITSPPYNVGTRHNGKDNESMYGQYEDDMTESEYEGWLFNVIDELLRTTKQHIFFNIQMLGRNKETILRMQGKYAKYIKDIIIWNKAIAPPHIQPGVMNSKFEFIFIFSNDFPEKKKFTVANWSQGSFSNVIEGMNASQNQFSHLNKATFPTYLPRTLMQKFCTKGQLIYDPFNGTGTVAEACAIEGMDFIGTDIDDAQLKATVKRYANQKLIQQLPFE